MATLRLLDIPDDLYGALEQRASTERRSVEEQAVALLKEALDVRPADNRERRRRVLEEIDRRNLPDTSKWPDPVQLIREDRDR